MPATTVVRPMRVVPPDDSLAGSQQSFSPAGIIYPTDSAGWGWSNGQVMGVGATRLGIVNAAGYRTFSLELNITLGGGAATLQYSQVDTKNIPTDLFTPIAISGITGGANVYTWGQSGGAWPLFNLMSIWLTVSVASVTVTTWGPLLASSP